ncbi:uncharacterized protein LOC129614948 [Condylostylus longicornis]|uniref:uncharacterized protein LOC129614948 n=1 Tax=Condylostylus longicornis TaxID=2530218 RepID=UPI00244E318B|nr:uncharacterized protein LOC129614948 [Condylostylus longicornis]
MATNNTDASTSSATANTIAPLQLTIDPMQYIQNLPEFNGKGEELYSFVELVDNICPLILRYDRSSQKILLNKVKSRVIYSAREVLEINNNTQSWSEMKSVLINNFRDSKTALQIYDELRAVSFATHSVDLFNEIKKVLRRLNNKVKTDPNSVFTTAINIETALKIFKDKLPEPMRFILYCRNPATIEEAMHILHECNYAY